MEVARQREESERMSLVVSLWNVTTSHATSGLIKPSGEAAEQPEPQKSEPRTDEEAVEEAVEEADEEAVEEDPRGGDRANETEPGEADLEAGGSDDERHIDAVTRNLGREINAAK